MCILMVLVISCLSPYFLGAANLRNLLLSVAILGMIAVSSTMLMIGDGLDLSVGATSALVGVVAALTQDSLGVWGAAPFGTLLGIMILGTLNNAMTLLSVSAYYQQVAQGVVLLLAVGLDQLRFGSLGRILRSRT